MRRSVLLVLLSGSALVAGVLAGAVASSPVASAAADAPIVGTWTGQFGSVVVQSTGTTSYVGVTATPTNFGNACTHPAGQQMWTMSGSGTSYSGTHVGFWVNDCSDNPGPASFTITEATPGTLTLVVDNGYTPRPTYTKPGTLVAATPAPSPSPSWSGSAVVPRVNIKAPRGLIQQGGRVVEFDVTVSVQAGDELINWQVNVYDGNNLKPLTYQYGPIYDTREWVSKRVHFSFAPSNAAPSAYFVCAYAITSSTGAKSANAPWTACAWIKVDQVLYGRWTSRKTCASPDDASDAYAWMTSVRKYAGIRVDFRDACGMRDSGYRGIVVQEPLTRKWYDFRMWTRAQVDDLFYQLLDLECRTQIPNTRRYAAARSACRNGAASTGSQPDGAIGARTFYTATRSAFLPYFDADLTAGGVQTTTNPAALPQGGQRDNS
ncbi:MAG: hypothetical protein Q8M17_00485 [Actinomycetota bacterium]|nr:hypothetical protein [Actinomycetota bacterium]